MDLICHFKKDDTEVTKEMSKFSMILIKPVFHSSPMVGMNPAVDIYIYICNLTFEPLCSLPLEYRV